MEEVAAAVIGALHAGRAAFGVSGRCEREGEPALHSAVLGEVDLAVAVVGGVDVVVVDMVMHHSAQVDCAFQLEMGHVGEVEV